MIRLFTKIRRTLLNDKKFSKYLLYALGEIVLVVIGILIALQINNWNDNRKGRLKIDQILTKVREELALNISNANDLSNSYRTKERKIGKVLRREVTIEDYKNSNLVYLIWNSNTVDISDDAAKELDGLTELLSEEQNALVSRINKLYGYYKPTIDVMDKEIEQTVSNFELSLKSTKNWYYLSNNLNSLPESAFNYFLKDTSYLNEVAYYETNGLQNHFTYNTLFMNEAKNLYIDLSKHLGAEIDIELIRPVTSFNDIYGTYINKEPPSNDTITIRRQDQRLYYDWITENGTITYPLYPDSDDAFIIGLRYAELIRDKESNPVGLKLTLGSSPHIEYEKLNN